LASRSGRVDGQLTAESMTAKLAGGAGKMPAAELPCEKATRVIIPSIRAALVRYLVEERKMTRYSVAKLLGITPASVTYYMKGLRGDPSIEEKLLEIPEYKGVIVRMAELLIANNGIRDGKSYRTFKTMVCSVCSRLNDAARLAGCGETD